MKRPPLLLLATWALLLVALAVACVQPEEGVGRAVGASTDCRGADASPSRYLRQLSLDLRGAPPTTEEYRRVAEAGDVPTAMVDEMLRDGRFLGRVRAWHADQLWPSMAGFELYVGAKLVVVPGRGRHLSAENINPEWLVQAMDRRTAEPVCPAPDDPAHLTAASCCTSSNPNHPACCLVRHRAYDPDDPACVAKSAALPAVFNYGVVVGDQHLRGGAITYTGCDSALEYPPERVAADDRRWPHDAAARPYYTSPRTGARRYYYDERGVPLPYDDAAHCPNYCRAARPTGPGGAWARADYVAKRRLVGAEWLEGDGPGYACPEGYAEIANRCDNEVDTGRLTARVEMRQEGWRLARPWWALGHWVKTCAYEAQERTVSLNNRLPCRPGQFTDSSCGCGPRGAWCAPFTGELARLSGTLQRLMDAINREPLEIIASVVARDEPYEGIFTTPRGVANGPLAFMNRYQAEQVGELDFSPSAPPDALPDVPLEDDTWHEYPRHPWHAGVLTTPVFLARFGTLRSRINRFRTAFLCRPFEPPATPPPPPEHPCNRETNLARRCGCQHCHASMEPLGAAWGRWAERATNYLDPARFPAVDAACANCGGVTCPRHCRNYVTSPIDGDSVPFLGTLQSYLYRSPEEVRRIEAGPRSIIGDTLASGELQSCTARTAWARLLNRPMSAAEQSRVLPALVRDFEAHGRSYRALVRAIVTSPAYRRID